ncbi:MAG: helix-turn-helix transcriptional regulator [Candidatus Gastranaerophilales bacterium]
MELKKQIGEKIKQIRKNKGFTQEQLAEMIEIEVPNLSNLERGKFAPSIDTLQKLSKALNAHTWEFYYFNDISNETMSKEINDIFDKKPKLIKIIYNFLKIIENNI